MSWVISTCMACTGVVLASLDPMSLSGAPWRAMPPEGSMVVAMGGVWRTTSKRCATRCESRTQMSSREPMHGESTQAVDREQAARAG